jgi:hypothetical protein
MARFPALLLLVGALLAGTVLGQRATSPTQWVCRMDPSVGAQFCGLPFELVRVASKQASKVLII